MLIELFLLHLFYAALYLTWKSNREQIKSSAVIVITITATTLLNNPIFRQSLLLVESFRSRMPVIKKDGQIIHITYKEDGTLYHIHLPYNRRQQARTYELTKGDTVVRFAYPKGVAMYCTAQDLGYETIQEVEV